MVPWLEELQMIIRTDDYYSNPPNKSYLILAIIGWMILAVFSILYYYLTRRTAAAALGFLIGMLYFLLIYYIEYIGRPLKVKVLEDSFILNRRLRSEVTIPFSRIVIIYYHTGNSDTFFGRFSTDGAIGLFGRTYAPVRVSPTIAKAIQQRYFEKMGHYPEKYPGSDG